MTKRNDDIEDVILKHKKLKEDLTLTKRAGKTVAEVLDTMKKHPGMKMDVILRNMQGH